jgi:hypothetical protein
VRSLDEALRFEVVAHLFATPLAIAIVAEGHDVALALGSFKVVADNVLEPKVTIHWARLRLAGNPRSRFSFLAAYLTAK